MNFLAHCLIGHAAATPARGDLVAGGFLADFAKGPVARQPLDLQDGIRLHRRIDAYSGEHPACRASARRFPTPLRRAAPIFVDVIADHCLATAWQRHAAMGLEAFTAECYQQIGANRSLMDERARDFLDYAARTDLFARYAQWPVIERALGNLVERLGNRFEAAEVLGASQQLLDALRGDFEEYFPDMLTHAREFADRQFVSAER